MKFTLPRQRKLIELIVTFNLVGLIGFIIPATRPVFIQLVPWHLLMMGILLALGHERVGWRFAFFFVMVYISTFAAEWTGVHKHWLFGYYFYGNTMGRRLWDIPLIMGITWFLLVYSAGILMQRIGLKYMLLRVLAGALLLVFLDMFIEPIAILFDYWHWMGAVPFSNYAGWFGVSTVMLLVFEAFRFEKQGWAAPVFLLMQFVFFFVLDLMI